jgi:hypothetical protein
MRTEELASRLVRWLRNYNQINKMYVQLFFYKNIADVTPKNTSFNTVKKKTNLKNIKFSND